MLYWANMEWKSEGQIVRLNFEEIQEALKQANEQLGDGWRLPTKIELEGIVCQKCERGNKIDSEFFPPHQQSRLDF